MRKTIKHTFSMFLYSDKTDVFDQSERAQGPIYILKQNTAVYALITFEEIVIVMIKGWIKHIKLSSDTIIKYM